MGGSQSNPINDETEGILGGGETARSKYYNPDPLAQLIGPMKETEIILKGAKMKALIDTGANISLLTDGSWRNYNFPFDRYRWF